MIKEFLDLPTNITEGNFIAQSYQNAMELLVEQEINKQIQAEPSPESINTFEVAAYALNKLPPLYASSEEGLYRQQERGKKEFKEQIETSVRQALEFVRQNPVRFTTPLDSAKLKELQESKAAFQELLDWLWLAKKETVSWPQLIATIKEELTQITMAEIAEELGYRESILLD